MYMYMYLDIIKIGIRLTKLKACEEGLKGEDVP